MTRAIKKKKMVRFLSTVLGIYFFNAFLLIVYFNDKRNAVAKISSKRRSFTIR